MRTELKTLLNAAQAADIVVRTGGDNLQRTFSRITIMDFDDLGVSFNAEGKETAVSVPWANVLRIETR